MDLKELDSFKMSDAITFHDKLNPKLFRGTHLQSDVSDQLKVIAQDFLQELGIKGLDVKDITISGSNAAYSYTPNSDLDLHILVDLSQYPDDEIYQELFHAKKTIYNDSHNIKVHGIPVELYVQDSNEPVISLGEYSILKDKWLRIPTKRRSNLDQTATKQKYEKLLKLAEYALKSKKLGKVKQVLQTIKRYRQAGLDKGGEFGPENLAFKALRSQGIITKLYDLRDKLHSQHLSIESMYSNDVDEDYHPNGKPPGPEFQPTMPAGTVKVDVSDVYDWYKLGQHISNLKGLGQHDFGSGPPSTILSFGDEDTEHKYIKDLEKTGLTTTDIDPVDPNQPKGMKRQKTDPTYNVSEDTKTTEHYNGIEISLEVEDDEVMVTAMMANGREMGHVLFIQEGDYLMPQDLEVEERYQGQGIAATMYDYVKSKGYKIRRSGQQTDAGAGFWNKHRPEQNVWEDDTMQYAAEKTSAINPYGGLKDVQYRGSISEVVDNDFLHSIEAGVDQTVEMNGYSFRVKNSTNLAGRQHRPGIVVTVYDNKHLVAWGDFVLHQDKKDSWLESHDTEVVEKYQNKGIATMMYAIIKSLGFDIKPSKDQSTAGKNMWGKWGKDANHLVSEASGYIPSEKEKNDPRFKTALTVDVKPDSIKKNAKAFAWLTDRAGVPPTAKTSGKIS